MSYRIVGPIALLDYSFVVACFRVFMYTDLFLSLYRYAYVSSSFAPSLCDYWRPSVLDTFVVKMFTSARMYAHGSCEGLARLWHIFGV